ncbi:MAG TPA: DUF2267 domain-containing protein [Anaerolineae bacterium]|nr:DUF2267 domain-containing protein [Anaerolineae bacterium]
MDELVKMIAGKVGISEDQARQAVGMVMAYLKDQLPEPVAGQVEAVLGGEGGGLDVQGLVGGLGKMFG